MTLRPLTTLFLRVAVLALLSWSGLGFSAGGTAAVPETRWEDLMPKGWDPYKDLRKDPSIGMLDDGNPRMFAMMRKLRQLLDDAPTVAALDGTTVRLPGYVVPLEESREGLREFLLVPYFGACVHSPPPPANQIAYVVAAKPVKGVRSMDAVWVTGMLKVQRQDTLMGASAYEIVPSGIEPYVASAKR